MERYSAPNFKEIPLSIPSKIAGSIPEKNPEIIKVGISREITETP